MNITMHKNVSKMEKSIRAKLMDFLMKLDADETSPGLHIEPIRNSADRRFRTGRVDKFWRAVLFKLTGKTGTSWVIYGVYPHDDAITMAANLKLDVNPTNGVTEIRLVDRVDAGELESRLASSDGPEIVAADVVPADKGAATTLRLRKGTRRVFLQPSDGARQIRSSGTNRLPTPSDPFRMRSSSRTWACGEVSLRKPGPVNRSTNCSMVSTL